MSSLSSSSTRNQDRDPINANPFSKLPDSPSSFPIWLPLLLRPCLDNPPLLLHREHSCPLLKSVDQNRQSVFSEIFSSSDLVQVILKLLGCALHVEFGESNRDFCISHLLWRIGYIL